jgi:hypothetical protein
MTSLGSVQLDGLARPDGAPPGFTDTDLLMLETVRDGEYHVRFEELPNDRGSGGDLRRFCADLMVATRHLGQSSAIVRALLNIQTKTVE